MVAKHDGIVLKSNKQFMWFSWKNLISAYHLYGKPRISGKNSNETVHPLGIFRVKRYYLPRYMFHLFTAFTETTKIFCTIGVNYQYHRASFSRENPKNLPVFCKWYNSIPFMFSMRKKIIIIIKIRASFSRENPKNLPVFCKWYNSIPFMFSMRKKIIIIIKIPVPFVGKFWSIFQFTSYFLLLRTELSLPRNRFCLVT